MSDQTQPPPSTSTGLAVPIVIWGPKPPENKIGVVRFFPDGKTIITGADNGHIIVWKLKSDGLVPIQLMIGHLSTITAISHASNLLSSTRFVSTSEDGQICLWEIQDGRCIDSVPTVHVHRYMEPFTYKSSRHSRATRLFCIGDYSDILVLDPQDLAICFNISSRVEPDWICCYTIIQRSTRKCEQLIGMTNGGMLKVWTLCELERKDTTTALYEDESRRLEITQVSNVAFNPMNERILLIVASSVWMVIDIENLSILVQQKAEMSTKILSGNVISIDKVVIGYSDQSIKVFQLPLSSLEGPQIDEHFGNAKPQNYFGVDEPLAIGLLEGVKKTTASWYYDTKFAFFTGLNEYGLKENWVCRTIKKQGNVLVWKLPAFDDSFMKAVPSANSLPFKFKGTYTESLESIWESLNEKEDASLPVLNSGSVCCSMFVSSQGKLFLGRSDGLIVMTYACETLSRQWLSVHPERATSRKLYAHTAAVRNMFYPYEHDTRFDPQVFLSGSDDFSVVVWNINTASKLHRFIVHGGPVTKFLIPPSNCSKQMSKCICTIALDNSVALLNIRDNKCALLASRHPHPVKEVKWRPLDDFMLVKLDDGSVYVWQMETANIDRIIYGLVAEDVMAACDEQIGVEEGTDETSANHAVQLIRALKNKNIDAVKQKVVGSSGATTPVHGHEEVKASTALKFGPPMSITPLPGCEQGAHMIQFEVGSLIAGILNLDSLDSASRKAAKENQETGSGITGLSKRLTWQFEVNFYLDVARLMLSMLHAWGLDEDLDEVCRKKLSLHKPFHEIYFGNISKQGEMCVSLPSRFTRDFDSFARKTRWQASHSLNTNHLLAIIAAANTLMEMHNSVQQITKARRSVTASYPSEPQTENTALERQQMKQGWSLVAALHCALLPEHVRPRSSYAAPSIEMLARRWQDSCLEIREAAQALLIKELSRLGSDGRKRLLESWAPFLPPLLDDEISIFGSKLQSSSTISATTQPPPIPPRQKTSPPNVASVRIPEPATADGGESGVQQVRRNQATSIILLAVIGAEFGDDLHRSDLTRATALSLLELLVAAPSVLLPVYSPLRRAAIDLLGRGFVHWEPHLEISKVLLGLLDLASSDRSLPRPVIGTPLQPIADASRTARQALSQIALARPPALLTALSMEVARYNAAAQHQTIQHTVESPLLKSKNEVLQVVEELCEKRHRSVEEMMLPVGDILVHCLDPNLLKHKPLNEVFPPMKQFYNVSYCTPTRRIAFGGKSGSTVVHELKTTKTHSLPGHSGPVSTVSFSEDGKILATYGAQDGKLNFYQTSQTFLGMGQNQMKLMKTIQGPTVSIPTNQSADAFRPKLIWMNNKSVSLMLPEGREQRFAVQ